MRVWLILLFGLLCTGCLDQSRNPPTLKDMLRPEDPNAERNSQAEAEMVALDDELTRNASLPPAARRERELAMEPRLKKALEITSGTRMENKAVYYLANWRYTYREGDGVDQLLTRLNGLPSPAMKSTGVRLRVLLLLRQGRVSEAKTMAQALVAEVPEFSPLLERVTFHETIGASAPTISSRNLTGGPDEPVTKRTEPWLFYLFVDNIDEQSLHLIERYLDALAILPPAERRLVCVTFESNLLSATTRIRNHPRAGEIDLLWASPGDNGNAKEWRSAWKLPSHNPHIALLGPGPDRTIMAVEVTPENLRMLLTPAPVPAKK
ncbi:MAG: hypothetical protein H0W78_16945 [Planctomycetes bacterium]|nr:hypothetical protein [Planctomycetota bacterium]